MSFYIYTIHNILNNKIYVGKSKNTKTRWKKHLEVSFCKREKERFYVHRAIAKYGIDNFVFSIIQQFENKLDTNFGEKYWIKFFNAKNPQYGYNLTDGGEGVPGRIMSESTKQKIREKATGRKHSKETLISMSGDNCHSSKLTLNKVKEIRHKYGSLETSLVSLAKEYGVSDGTIANIIYNIYWYDENYTQPVARKINSNGKPKLTQEKADQIREMYAGGISVLELSKLFSVTDVNIRHIINNKTWRKNV